LKTREESATRQTKERGRRFISKNNSHSGNTLIKKKEKKKKGITLRVL